MAPGGEDLFGDVPRGVGARIARRRGRAVARRERRAAGIAKLLARRVQGRAARAGDAALERGPARPTEARAVACLVPAVRAPHSWSSAVKIARPAASGVGEDGLGTPYADSRCSDRCLRTKSRERCTRSFTTASRAPRRCRARHAFDVLEDQRGPIVLRQRGDRVGQDPTQLTLHPPLVDPTRPVVHRLEVAAVAVERGQHLVERDLFGLRPSRTLWRSARSSIASQCRPRYWIARPRPPRWSARPSRRRSDRPPFGGPVRRGLFGGASAGATRISGVGPSLVIEGGLTLNTLSRARTAVSEPDPR
jgi:hypothetical protein